MADNRTAADQFISGKPAVYSGFDGALYTAIFASGEKNRLGVSTLTIKNSRGKTVSDVFMAEHKARSFFWNLDAQAEY